MKDRRRGLHNSDWALVKFVIGVAVYVIALDMILANVGVYG